MMPIPIPLVMLTAILQAMDGHSPNDKWPENKGKTLLVNACGHPLLVYAPKPGLRPESIPEAFRAGIRASLLYTTVENGVEMEVAA